MYILNFFPRTERQIDAKLDSSIEMTCRSKIDKIVQVGNPNLVQTLFLNRKAY